MLSTRFLADGPVFATSRLRVRGVGVRETMPPAYIERPDGTGDFLFMLFHSTVQIGVLSVALAFGPGTMALWRPGGAQSYGNLGSRWSHSWIHCDGPLVEEGMRNAPRIKDFPVLLANPLRVERYLLDIHDELRGASDDAARSDAINTLRADAVIVENTLSNLLREAARNADGGGARRPPEPLLLARNTIEAHYDQNLTLSGLAAAAHLSVPHFCSEFKRWFGVPPISYVIRRRMEAAAVLLSDTSLNVGEVGRRVGYDDQYHFSKLFTQNFGMAPSRFRQRGSERVPRSNTI